MDAYWRAANDLSAGQIYLYAKEAGTESAFGVRRWAPGQFRFFRFE